MPPKHFRFAWLEHAWEKEDTCAVTLLEIMPNAGVLELARDCEICAEEAPQAIAFLVACDHMCCEPC